MRAALSLWGVVLLLFASSLPPAGADESPTKLQAGEVLRGNFVQERYLEGFSAPLRTTGKFVLSSDKGLIWQAETPFATTTVMTAHGILQMSNDVETMNLSTRQAPMLAALYDTLGGALVGDLAVLERTFKVTKKVDAVGWLLILVPRDKNGAGKQIREIRIDGNRLVDQVDIVKNSGDRDSLTFLNQTIDQAPLGEAELKLLTKAGQQ